LVLYVPVKINRRKNKKKALPNLIRQRFPDVSGVTKTSAAWRMSRSSNNADNYDSGLIHTFWTIILQA